MIIVVAALLIHDGKLLISQRLRDSHLGLYWEFPGGKLETGETPEQALERELFEELGIKTRTGRIYDAICHKYGDSEIMLLFYKSEWLEGEPRPLESERITWAAPCELVKYSFAPADERLIKRLVEKGFND